jgi:DNA-binding NtrC family response regulator
MSTECASLPHVSRPAAPAQAPTGTEVILVVDDDAGVRLLARNSLEAFGYTALEASSADEAVRVAGRHLGRIHLLLADIRMPGGGGGTLAAVLSARRPSMKVLLMSGYYTEPAGPQSPAFLPKPFSPTGLARAVRQVLDHG